MFTLLESTFFLFEFFIFWLYWQFYTFDFEYRLILFFYMLQPWTTKILRSPVIRRSENHIRILFCTKTNIFLQVMKRSKQKKCWQSNNELISLSTVKKQGCHMKQRNILKSFKNLVKGYYYFCFFVFLFFSLLVFRIWFLLVKLRG